MKKYFKKILRILKQFKRKSTGKINYHILIIIQTIGNTFHFSQRVMTLRKMMRFKNKESQTWLKFYKQLNLRLNFVKKKC